jgi:hypothetical protein
MVLFSVIRWAARVPVVLLCVASAVTAAGGPIASLGSEVVDLGRLDVKDSKRVEIEIWNQGDAPLEIVRVQSSCPCALPDLAFEPRPMIPANSSFMLPIKYVPDGRSIGEAGATIAVHTSDPGNPILIVELTVFIVVPVIVRPDSGVIWSLHPRGSRLPSDLAIYAGAPEKTFELKSIEVLDPSFRVETEYIEHRGEDGLRGVRVYFDVAADAPLGLMATAVVARVVIDGEEMEVKAPMQGDIIGDIFVIPPSIISPKTAYKNGDPISQIIVRASSEGVTPRITGALTEGPLRVEILPPSTEAPEQRIQVFAGKALTGGPQSGQIHVMTTSPDQPITTIPVYFRAARPIEASPQHLVLERGASGAVTLRAGSAVDLHGASLDYDAQLVRVTINGGVAGAVTATVEHIAPSLAGDAATTVTVRDPEGAWVSIPILLRVD